MSTQAPSRSFVSWRAADIDGDHASGCVITTADGTELLDFTAGIGVVSTGHCHPRVVAAIQEQAARFIHAQANLVRHAMLEPLGEALAEIAPPGIDHFFYANSGAEAIESFVKFARQATRRSNVIVFEGSFHGRTLMAAALTMSNVVYRAGFGPLPEGVYVAPYPYAYAMGEDPETASELALEAVRKLFKTQTAPEDTAGILVEPVLGEGGYVVPPPSFLVGLREICDEHGMALGVDEVQCGVGRTGRWWACEHSGVSPDILCFAKGIASGFPISGVGLRPWLLRNATPGSHGGTYGGNAIGCAAALATLEVIRDERLVENAAERGRQLLAACERLQERHAVIGDVRGLGLMVGLELTDPARVRPVLTHMLESGKVLALSCGPGGAVIRFVPPLIVREAEVERAVAALDTALAETA
ncbi:aspartate aminotransferase family protein [Capillimicrobium parvum]|uniref:(S)-3-amino-2-methylpropionate transaminase n=1 Tax=Capillimicrobium parvum TaxID=2884022 RepID=A0A9E6XX21_9ACTN|nr:aminotransferase class III-fold pyridoxal phosphate-dependent enzyme [Capillimicrobium parvum]UGS35959.1 5-aminovalerate aminotransferase DavT [Capillimicrobium parvum]